jgi:hypothetical protein
MKLKKRKPSLLSDQELDAILRKARSPALSALYSEEFPEQVIKQLAVNESTTE